MANREKISFEIAKVAKSREELSVKLRAIRPGTHRTKHRDILTQIKFKDGIITGLNWAWDNLK